VSFARPSCVLGAVLALALAAPSGAESGEPGAATGAAHASGRCCIVAKFGFAPLVLSGARRVWGVAVWRVGGTKVSVYAKGFKTGARGARFVRLPIEFRRWRSGRRIYRLERTLTLPHEGGGTIAVSVESHGDHEGREIPGRVSYGLLTHRPVSGDSVFRMVDSYCTTQDADEVQARHLPARNSGCHPV
jgi:hypothetical protein